MNVLLLKFSMVIQKKVEVLSEKINLMRRKFIWNILCPEKKLFLVWPFLHAHAPRKFLNFKLIWETFLLDKNLKNNEGWESPLLSVSSSCRESPFSSLTNKKKVELTSSLFCASYLSSPSCIEIWGETKKLNPYSNEAVRKKKDLKFVE